MSRISTVFLFFCFIFVLVLSRLYYWQIVARDALQAEADSQHYFKFSLPAVRGEIRSWDATPLVMNDQVYLVYAEPKNIENLGFFAKSISEILSVDMATLLTKISDNKTLWVPLKHKVGEDIVSKLKTLKMKGLGYERESHRYYPESSMSAHILGFVGSDENGNDKGYFGLEGYYNRELRGKNGSLLQEKDVRGAPILVGDVTRIDPENGRTLVLYLDRIVQHIIEKKLLDGIEKYGAKEGSIVIMDPKIGGIIASASFPSYDPSNYTAFDKGVYKNPVVGSSYEPGSTFKSLVMAAGIEEGAVTPMTTMDESGPVRVGEYAIRTWNNEYHGKITMTQILERSSNVGMVYVGEKLGKDKLLQYIHDFGFGQATGVDLEDESSPELRESSKWGDIDLATASFGQGIAVTPLQMVRAVAALANGGMLMEPHVVREMRDLRGNVFPVPVNKIRRVVSERTAKQVTEMLVSSVDNGEAKWAKPKGYRIAGKTGTAQIPVAGHYDATKTIASFVGYAPADDPKFVMLVLLSEPSSSQWGSETAAPLFFSIAKELFLHYNIAPIGF
ncbi:penicillin-binding protein 2 [Candidatus Gottesmanbacteria bacterium]|nr:penicillin-binding protein 2 [Candidatus Gottesmanbacteria bacterium]